MAKGGNENRDHSNGPCGRFILLACSLHWLGKRLGCVEYWLVGGRLSLVGWFRVGVELGGDGGLG